MAVGNINELPENILLELFIHIPARQLLLRCRPVCSLWRDLIDLVTLWKRKCLQEGFITEDWDQPVADWKIFYFLRSLQRNLLHNPCAEEGFEFWSLDVNGGDEWKVEDLSKDQRKEFPNDQVKKYFVTSYYTCLKSQVVDLKAEGYWEELMDTTGRTSRSRTGLQPGQTAGPSTSCASNSCRQPTHHWEPSSRTR